ARPPAERNRDPRDVRLRPGDVAARGIDVRDGERATGDLLERGDRLDHARLLPAADVVDGAARRALHRGNRRLDRVGDVGEAPRLAAAAVDLEGVAGGERV